ncbi:MAG: guanylate kinase [Lachnospira sp.]|nr:guanylate kinase [Lachnospira sp.]
MPEIIFLMGKSASGKDKIRRILETDPQLLLHPVVIYTTRPMRQGERQGVDYHFVSCEEAAELFASGRLIEKRTYETIQGPWHYFSVDDGQILTDGKTRYLAIGTLESYMAYVRYFGQEHVFPVLIWSRDDVRLLRAIHREQKQEHPDYQEVCRRFLADSEDFSEENIRKARISERFENDGSLEECVEKIRHAILENTP